MATCVIEPKVGQYVYKHCSPQRAGVIVTVDGKTLFGHFWGVHVKWLDGTVTDETTASLKDFNALIADHEKKLNTHKTTRQKLMRLDLGLRMYETQ